MLPETIFFLVEKHIIRSGRLVATETLLPHLLFSSVSIYSLLYYLRSVTSGLWVPLPSCLRRGPRGYCRSEWRTGGENRFLALSVSAEHESGQVICTHFQVFAMTRVKIEPSLPALVARAQPTVPPTRSIVPLRRAFIIL